MPLQLFAIAAGLIIGWMRKGSLLSLINIKLKWLWMLPIAYLLQLISINFLHGSIYRLMLVTSYLLLVTFCVGNLRVAGIWWTLAGTSANFLVMSVNGLRMPAYMPPVYQFNQHLADLLQRGEVGKSVAMSDMTHLNFLGDIFFLRIQPPTLVSLGDLLFAIGIAVLLQYAMREKREAL